jgi:hypothetical protein
MIAQLLMRVHLLWMLSRKSAMDTLVLPWHWLLLPTLSSSATWYMTLLIRSGWGVIDLFSRVAILQ